MTPTCTQISGGRRNPWLASAGTPVWCLNRTINREYEGIIGQSEAWSWTGKGLAVGATVVILTGGHYRTASEHQYTVRVVVTDSIWSSDIRTRG